MFDTKKTSLTGRLADAVDLAIDFATLGEYGLEPADRITPPCQISRKRDFRSPGRAQARARGVREASGKPTARGAAWQRHASRGSLA